MTHPLTLCNPLPIIEHQRTLIIGLKRLIYALKKRLRRLVFFDELQRAALEYLG
jgi:hypothetical protein